MGKPLEVYGILPGTNQVCLLPGTQKTPATLAPRPLPALGSISDPLGGYIERLNGDVIPKANEATHPKHIRRGEALVIEGWVVTGDGETANGPGFRGLSRG